MSRAATSLRVSGEALLRRGSATALSSPRALAIHPTSPAIHVPRRLLSHPELIRLESRLARIEAESVERHELASAAVGRANGTLAAAANTAADRAFESNLDVGKVSLNVACTVLGLAVGGGVFAVHGFRITTERATRDRTEALVAEEISKMRVGLVKALDEVLSPDEKVKLAALADLEAREKAAAATSIKLDSREKSLQAREQALSKRGVP